MISVDLPILDKFLILSSLIQVDDNNNIFFPFDQILYDDEWINFISHPDWKILNSKITNLVILISKDIMVLEKDVETELWDMI